MKVFLEGSVKEKIALWLMVGATLLPLVPYAMSN